MAHPERRRSCQRQHVREEVARCIHDVDMRRSIREAYVNVQTEDQERSGQQLEFFDEVVVSVIGRNDLIFPMRERMRTGCGYRQPVALGGDRKFATVR